MSIYVLLPCCFRPRFRDCPLSDDDLHPAFGNRDHLDRNGLSADRRRILLRYRALVSALRLLPRYPPSGNVARPHGHFTRHARITVIPARSASIHRRIRYLVVDSDRLVPCRCRRTSLYAFFEEYDFQKRTPIK